MTNLVGASTVEYPGGLVFGSTSGTIERSTFRQNTGINYPISMTLFAPGTHIEIVDNCFVENDLVEHTPPCMMWVTKKIQSGADSLTITRNGVLMKTGQESYWLHSPADLADESYATIDDNSETRRCANVCGDGVVMPGIETCDDIGTVHTPVAPQSGDGCDDMCQVEAGWECEQQTSYYGRGPSVCTPRPMIPSLSTGSKTYGGSPFILTIAFSQPAKTESLAVTDVQVSGSAEVSLTNLQGLSNKDFTIDVQPVSDTQGDVSFQMREGRVELLNAPGHFNEASQVLTISIDTSKPEPVLLSSFGDGVTMTNPFLVTVSFQKAIDVDTLETTDFVLTGRSHVPVSASVASIQEKGSTGQHFDISVSIAGEQDGDIQIQLPAEKIDDTLGNPNVASNILIVTYEKSSGGSHTTDSPKNPQNEGPPDPSDGTTTPPLPPNVIPIPLDEVDIVSGGADGDPAEGCQASYYGTGSVEVRVSCSDSESRKFMTLAEGSPIATVEGSRHDDTLRGNSQSNTLIGGDGADLLDGRGGDDQLIGGRGADSFVIGREPGEVTILDFDTGSTHDRLNLVSFPSIKSMKDIQERMTIGSVIINLDESNRVRILHRTPQEMTNPDFFLLDEGEVGKEDDECGFFSYAKPECLDTILSIVGGILAVAASVAGFGWAFVRKCLCKRKEETGKDQPKATTDARKRSKSDTRESRAKSILETKSERQVDRDVTDKARLDSMGIDKRVHKHDSEPEEETAPRAHEYEMEAEEETAPRAHEDQTAPPGCVNV